MSVPDKAMKLKDGKILYDDLRQRVENVGEDVSTLNFALSRKAPVIISEASGAIASFSDGIGGEPLVDCVVSIEPVQSGSGDPAPDNVRPISGWTGCTVSRTGKNLCDPAKTDDSDANFIWAYRGTGFVFKAGQAYTLSSKSTGSVSPTSTRIVSVDETTVLAQGVTSCTFIPTVDTVGVIRLWGQGVNLSNTQPMLEIGSTASEYTPYAGQTYPISWQTAAGTVYGGQLDVTTGVLTVDRAIVDLGTLTWTRRQNPAGALSDTYLFNAIIANSTDPLFPKLNFGGVLSSFKWATNYIYFTNDCSAGYIYGTQIAIRCDSYTDVTEFKTAMSGVQLVYELATPQTYQLTPTEITALTESNIWADCGGTEVSYKADTKGYVDNHSGGQQITVDSSLSSTSTNPVQNKVINTALAGKEPKHTVTTVSGSTPSITGVVNTQYKCGEVSTLTITPPTSGCIDVIFTSGSTPTVLTVTPPTGMTMRWANGFDPTALEANTTYEINILDGCLGVAGTWT